LAEAARRQLGLDKVYLVLTPQSPFKTGKKLSPLQKRLRWLNLSLKGKKKIKVGNWELKRKGPVYTAATLQRYKKLHPRDDIFFVMGSDAWKGFSRWKSPEIIADLSTLIIGRRPGSGPIKIGKKFQKSVFILKGIFPDISSTQIRNTVKAKKKAVGLLPPAVWKDLING
jgi:nicotinate-nucleotide adenylyltransferase